MRTPARALAAAAFAAALCVSSGARASDEKGFAALRAEYEKAAKKHDPDGVRERRKILLRAFDFLDQKACRKLLRQALDDEDEADTRVAVVQVLAASPDVKDLDAIVKALAKDRLRGPTIAIGEGIACADPAGADALAADDSATAAARAAADATRIVVLTASTRPGTVRSSRRRCAP